MSKTALVGGVATSTAIVYAAWVTPGWDSGHTVRIVDDLGLLAFSIFATTCSLLAALSSRERQRIAWICLTIGLGGWAVGEAIWSFYQLVLGLEAAPFPSVADIAYLIFPIGASAALVLFPAGYSTHSRTRLLLDGLIITAALFEISWIFVLEEVWKTGAESRFAAALSLAYPVSDILVLAVALLILARARTGQRQALMLLTAGCMLNALSDSAFAYLTAKGAYDGGWTDVGYVAALLLLGMAGLVGRRVPQAEETETGLPSTASVWLPYVPLAVAAVVCTPRYLPEPGLTAIYVSSTVLMSAVLARQFIAVRQNRRLLETVADQALRDPLTGLANRVLFNDRLAHAMQLHERDRQSVAVLSLDLDDFKLVNDSLGHAAGDELLVLVAERLLDCVRAADTVARLGGDEFAVLMEGRADHARVIAHRVFHAFDDPFYIEGRDLLIRSSVGLAVVLASDPDVSADALLKQADVAMYSAKRSRTGGVHTFTPDMHLIEPSEFRSSAEGGVDVANGAAAVQLLGELRRAIDQVDLSLVYQPKFGLSDGDIVGVEALIRWPHRDHGLLGPDHFLPLVREHGLMRSVTQLVLAKAFDDVAAWSAQGVNVPLAVNIFAPSLGDLDLPRQIVSALADRHLEMEMLTVEITEDLLLDNVDRTCTVLNMLRERGIRIAIDDFGSGYSALSYLRDLPIDEVKLDRQFVAPILVDSRAATIVRSVIDLSHDLGVTTVAEGVEDAETADRLREFGCDVIQGYYCSPPVAASAIIPLVRGVKPCCDDTAVCCGRVVPSVEPEDGLMQATRVD